MTGAAPFRIGATSFVYRDVRRPDSWLANVERLAGRVDDVELLLFEAGRAPGDAEIDALAAWRARAALTYTVHTPLDVSLASEDPARRAHAITQVATAIAHTARLAPEAYIVHVYLGDHEGDTPPADLAAWRSRATASLEAVLATGVEPARLCVETLDYDIALLAPVIDALGVSLALDLGHLDRDGRDERALIERYLPRTRSIQWHGVEPGGRDHRSLAHYPAAKARWVVEALRARYRGVVTLEVFREDDFEESLAVLHTLLAQDA